MWGVSWYYLNRCWSFSIDIELNFDSGEITVIAILRQEFETSHEKSIDGEKDQCLWLWLLHIVHKVRWF